MRAFDRFKAWLKTRKWKAARPEAVALLQTVVLSAMDGKLTNEELKRIAIQANEAAIKAGLWDWK